MLDELYIVCQNALETRWKLIYILRVSFRKGSRFEFEGSCNDNLNNFYKDEFHGSIFGFPLKSLFPKSS